MQEIDNALLPRPSVGDCKTSGMQSFAVTGIAGLGKTQVGIEYAFSRAAHFDVIIWLSANHQSKLDESFSEIAFELNRLSYQDSRDQKASKIAVLEWLSKPYKNPSTPIEGNDVDPSAIASWLLVFDDIQSPTTLRDHIPMHGNGAILITSRDPFSKSYISPGSGVDLSPFTPVESIDFLQSLTYSGSPEDSEGLNALTARLGGLPLALAHVSGVIKGKDLTFDECLQYYVSGFIIHSTDDLGLVRVAPYEHTLATAFALDNLTDPALRLLELISFLDSNKIQETVLSSHPAPSGLGYPSGISYIDARTELIVRSFVKRNKLEKTLTIHQVPQDVARSRLTATSFVNMLDMATVFISAEWPLDRTYLFGHLMSDWGVASRVLPHIVKMVEHYKQRNPSLTESQLQRFVSLVNRASIYLIERNNFALSLDLANFSEMLLIGSTTVEMAVLRADIVYSVASTYNHLGDADRALPYAELHFKLRMEVEDVLDTQGKGDHSYRAIAFNQLASTMCTSNKFTEAIEFAKKGRRLLEGTPEFLNDTYWPHWVDFFHAWGLIGLKRYDEALPIMTATLEWRKRHYGPDDTESMKTALALQILGGIQEGLLRSDEAVNSFERSLKLYSLTEGESSFRANQVRVKLGEHYARVGRIEGASLEFEAALKYFTGKPYYKRERARTFFKKHQFLCSIGEMESAAEAYQEAAGLYYEICPDTRLSQRRLTAEDFDAIVMVSSR
ncbi:hypothetical protein F5Y08DRAFT_235591 [Xylaria arbuscula]|nr:hypothetical protein F5Y08DRAFT_235591 [Xylaria arbuscula]